MEPQNLLITQAYPRPLVRKGLGDIFNRVQYAGDSYIVNRKGKPVGAIVPIELAQEIERLRKRRQSAKDTLLEMLERHKGFNTDMTDDEAMEEAVSLVQEVREERHNKKNK